MSEIISVLVIVVILGTSAILNMCEVLNKPVSKWLNYLMNVL